MSGESDRRLSSPDGNRREFMESQDQLRQEQRLERVGSGWFVGLGILMIVLGILAIARPLFASLAIELLLGALFVLGGIVQLIYAFRSHGAGSLALKVVLGLLYLAAGVLLLLNPLAGVVSLTLVVGIFFFIDGVLRVFLAFQVKPASNWGLVLLNGIITIILGILIWSQWPSNAPWILGLLVGIGLLVNGLFTVMFPNFLKRAV